MALPSYPQLIADGIRGLPPDVLAEIADFVFFVRKRALKQKKYEEELNRLSREEVTHLEKEFESYEQLYPRE